MGRAAKVDPPVRLRQRKKQLTRDDIERAALALFEAQGFDTTTLAQIADRADVAPRTIFAYFDSKEEIVFADETRFYERLEEALSHRPDDASTVDALRTFLTSPDQGDARQRLRGTIIAASHTLQARQRARSAEMERILRAAIARDLGAKADDIRPVLAAGAIAGGFTAARDRLLDGSGVPLSHEQTLRVLESVLTFAQGGLAASAETREPKRTRVARPAVAANRTLAARRPPADATR